MVKIEYSRAAVQDLEEIGDYIAQTLKSPLATLNTVDRIQDAVDQLSDFPQSGAPLSSVFEIITDYRFLICGNYLVFYRVRNDRVAIDRVLYGKRDYLSLLFRDLPRENEA